MKSKTGKFKLYKDSKELFTSTRTKRKGYYKRNGLLKLKIGNKWRKMILRTSKVNPHD
ncbi:hypothetical protein OAB57_00045 [Bacteriovoracaceae bacterium]|nr:hypothetical protein [Bacteriovoracaceae bacterium]